MRQKTHTYKWASLIMSLLKRLFQASKPSSSNRRPSNKNPVYTFTLNTIHSVQNFSPKQQPTTTAPATPMPPTPLPTTPSLRHRPASPIERSYFSRPTPPVSLSSFKQPSRASHFYETYTSTLVLPRLCVMWLGFAIMLYAISLGSIFRDLYPALLFWIGAFAEHSAIYHALHRIKKLEDEMNDWRKVVRY